MEAEKIKTQLNTANQNRSNYTVVTAHTRNHVCELSRKLRFIHASDSETFLNLHEMFLWIKYDDSDNKKLKS